MQPGLRTYLYEFLAWMESESVDLKRIEVQDFCDVPTLRMTMQRGELSISHIVSLQMIAEAANANLVQYLAREAFKSMNAALHGAAPRGEAPPSK